MSSVPAIYSGPTPAPSLGYGARSVAWLVAAACLGVLLTAAWLPPSPEGIATHTRTPGMHECQFLARTGLPCPSCGMTTSFAWFVRGNLLASLWVQPMGTALAALTAVAFWAALYIGITGKPFARLMRMIPPRYYVVPLLTLAILAWGW